MTVLCPAWMEKTINVTEFAPGTTGKTQNPKKVIVPKKKTVRCSCKVVGFVRVQYASLTAYRSGESKYDDIFGLCREHLALLSSSPAPWNRKVHWQIGAVSGQRGRVEVVEPAQVEVKDARRDAVLRIMTAFKSEVKRKMRQSNAKDLSVEDWRQLLSEAVDEWVTEEVMNS